MGKLKSREQQLEELLKFALDNLVFEVPYADPDSEFDRCVVCGRPDWQHERGCKGIEWKKQTRKILEEQ